MRAHKASQSGLILLGMIFSLAVSLMAQYRDNLGGSWNNPTSATITNIIMDRYAAGGLSKGWPQGQKTTSTSNRSAMAGKQAVTVNDSALHFRSTGTQLKTRKSPT